MTALSVNVFTLEFPNPQIFPNSDDTYEVEATISFTAPLPGNAIQTLSTSNAGAGSDIEGLLFVPDLRKIDPCMNISQQYIPPNVTRLADVPSNDLPCIAIAPWISPSCTKSYLGAIAGTADISAFVFYLIQDLDHNNYGGAQPPSPDNVSWDLGDNGSWKSQNNFPVYAINADTGDVIMKALGDYSGSMQSAPHGDVLVQQYDPRNYVRLYCSIDTGSGNTLPSLWVFLLIVLGLLLAMISITSLAMHFIQRRRRRELRHLVASEQIDIETLGIKRLRVPQEILDQLQLIVYVCDQPTSEVSASSITTREADNPSKVEQIATEGKDNVSNGSSLKMETVTQAALVESLPNASSLPHQTLDFSQPACPICLEDFISHETIVRPLPCKHVYHPACIDPVLREYSSLCPLCKSKVLPRGYCPEITNVMVRRVRGLARIRELERESTLQRPNEESRSGQSTRPHVRTVQGRMAIFRRQFGRQPRINVATTELVTVSDTSTGNHSSVLSNVVVPRPPDTSRADWARQRATFLVGRQLPAEEEERQQEAARPIWRKILGNVFPMFA